MWGPRSGVTFTIAHPRSCCHPFKMHMYVCVCVGGGVRWRYVVCGFSKMCSVRGIVLLALPAPLRAKAYLSGVRWMDYSSAGERGSEMKRGGCRPRFAHHYSPFSPCWYARLGYAVFPRSTFCSILCLVCNGPNPYRRQRRRRHCLQGKGCVQRRGEKVGRWQMRKGDIECVCVCASVCEWWCLRRRWPPSRTTRRSRVADTHKQTHTMHGGIYKLNCIALRWFSFSQSLRRERSTYRLRENTHIFFSIV